MKKILTSKIILLSTIVIVCIALTVFYLPKAIAEISPLKEESDIRSIYLDSSGVNLPAELIAVIEKELQEKPNVFFEGENYMLTGVREEENWRFISIAVYIKNAYQNGAEVPFGETSSLIAKQQEDQSWVIALQYTQNYADLLKEVPDEYFSAKAKQMEIIFPNVYKEKYLKILDQLPEGYLSEESRKSLFEDQSTKNSISYKFPWNKNNSPWIYTQGWHDGNDPPNPNCHGDWCAIDVGTNHTDKNVLSAASGVVDNVCIGTISANVYVRNDDGVLMRYVHLGITDVDVQKGDIVDQGDILGRL